jgi:hypothetical protein
MRANLIYKKIRQRISWHWPLIFYLYSPPSFLCWLFFFLSRSQEPPEPLLSRFLVFSGQERFFNSEFPKQERFFNNELSNQERFFNNEFSNQERFFNSEFSKQERFFNNEFYNQERFFNRESLSK